MSATFRSEGSPSKSLHTNRFQGLFYSKWTVRCEVNMMLCWQRLETSDWDHKLMLTMFTEEAPACGSQLRLQIWTPDWFSLKLKPWLFCVQNCQLFCIWAEWTIVLNLLGPHWVTHSFDIHFLNITFVGFPSLFTFSIARLHSLNCWATCATANRWMVSLLHPSAGSFLTIW